MPAITLECLLLRILTRHPTQAWSGPPIGVKKRHKGLGRLLDFAATGMSPADETGWETDAECAGDSADTGQKNAPDLISRPAGISDFARADRSDARQPDGFRLGDLLTEPCPVKAGPVARRRDDATPRIRFHVVAVEPIWRGLAASLRDRHHSHPGYR